VRKMVVVDHLVHKYDEILCSVHHGGHPASHHGPPTGEGHGGPSPKIQGVKLMHPAIVVYLPRCLCTIELQHTAAKRMLTPEGPELEG